MLVQIRRIFLLRIHFADGKLQRKQAKQEMAND